MRRPSSTAEAIDAKLSSAKIMSAASLDTAVPVMPMAIPTLACFKAGASLTPSPVIATTWPLACSAFTKRSLCSGATRAKTFVVAAASRRAAASSFASCAPVKPLSPGRSSPSCAPIASAVPR